MTNYDGPERRAADKRIDALDQRLDEAIGEVRKVYGVTGELAAAVSRTIPREEVEARERQFRWLLTAMIAATTVAMLLVPLFTRVAVTGRLNRLDDGQRIQQCLATKPEAERTGQYADTAVLACSQKVRR